jgi:hypothetical protein
VQGPGDRNRSLVVEYKASSAYTSLSVSTKENWSRCVDQIADYFGELRITQFQRSEKIRPVIRQWPPPSRAAPTTNLARSAPARAKLGGG